MARMSLKLHPELHLPKSHWSRHVLMQGSVGSGKTQILLPIIEQIIRADHKLFLYDTKGDFTSYFRKPIIVCPFDERSYYWDIAADCRYPLQAAMLAEILIPTSPDQKMVISGRWQQGSCSSPLSDPCKWKSLACGHGLIWHCLRISPLRRCFP